MAKKPKVELHEYDQTQAREEGFARVMILGPAKAGKTTCVATTAPGPVRIINCDGRDALLAPSNFGAKFKAWDVNSIDGWREACHRAFDEAEAGKSKTIVVDTITLLQETIVDGLKARGVEGWDIWTMCYDEIMHGFKELADADAHLFINAHMMAGDVEAEGILPAMQGKRLRVRFPAWVQDWVLLQVDPDDKKEPRKFVLGPQKQWTHSGRNIKRSVVIKADVRDLLEELGIQP